MIRRLDKSVQRQHKAVNANLAALAGTRGFPMSATTITKNCAINIDHSLGQSAGELSACWVYLKNREGALIGLEGAAYVLTNERQLVPMWTIIFYGGQTLERHRALYEAQRPYLDSRTKKLIKQAIEVDLIKHKMLGTETKPRTGSDDFMDAIVYGTLATKLIVDESSPVAVNRLKWQGFF
jgi:hypothetical protein